MSAQRIILVNCSRLLSDMLHAVLCKEDHLVMVQDADNHEILPSAIETSEAQWMIMPLHSDKNIPGWVDHYIAKHPSIRFLAIFLGSSKIKLKWLDYEEEVEDLSLPGLIHILEGHPEQV